MQINCGYLSATWDNSPTFIMTSVPHLPGQGSKGTQGTHVWDLEATARLLRWYPVPGGHATKVLVPKGSMGFTLQMWWIFDMVNYVGKNITSFMDPMGV